MIAITCDRFVLRKVWLNAACSCEQVDIGSFNLTAADWLL